MEAPVVEERSRAEVLASILKTLRDGNQDLTAAALVSEDGLLVAGELPDASEEARIGGMSATLLTLGTRAARELGLGQLQQTLVRGEDGYAVLVGASESTVLLVLTRPDAKLGLVFMNVNQAAKQIRQVI